MSSARELLAQLRGSPRLRWGLWAILGLLWAYGALWLRDEAAARADAYKVAARRAAQLEAEAGATAWLERAAAARALKAQVESRLWQASSAGLAQAAFQDWLSRSLQDAKVAQPTVTVTVSDTAAGEGAPARAADHPEDLWKVSAKLDFRFSPEILLALLEKLEGSPQGVVVESLQLRTEPTPRAEISVLAYFQRPAPGARAAP